MRQRRTRFLGGAAGALLVVAAACGSSTGSSPSPSSAEPPAPVPVPSASPTVTVATSPAAPGWQRAPDQAVFRDTGLTSVIWTGARFLATTLPGGDGALLDSYDGRAWHLQPPFKATGWTDGPTLVAAGPRGVVAIGGGHGGPLAIWHSADGLAWSAAPDQPAFQMRDGAFEGIKAVIAADDGWLAVGGEEYNNAPTPGLLRAVVLTSTDGNRWIRLPDQPALRYADMTAITRSSSGYIAVGTVLVDPSRGDSGLRAAAWTSPDGRAWSLVGTGSVFDTPVAWTGGGPTDAVLRGIAVHGDRLVAVGSVHPRPEPGAISAPPLAVAWRSDGAAWIPAKVGAFPDDRPLSITIVPDGFLAIVGSGPDCASGLWATGDGSTWRCTGPDPVFSGGAVWGAATSPGVQVLVGYNVADPVVATAWTLALR